VRDGYISPAAGGVIGADPDRAAENYVSTTGNFGDDTDGLSVNGPTKAMGVRHDGGSADSSAETRVGTHSG